MKHNCEIIRDLLPLYCDGVCSEASKNAVEEHISECGLCNSVYQKLSKDTNTPAIDAKEEETKVKFIKDVKNRMLIKKIIIAVVSVAASVGIIFGIYTLCTLPRWPIAYSEEAFTVADIGDMIAISYNGEDYQQIQVINNITATIDGEEKTITCIRFMETISSKYFTSGDNRRRIEDGGDMAFSKKDRDYMYYLEEGWTDDEVVDHERMAEKILNEGVLIWTKE